MAEVFFSVSIDDNHDILSMNVAAGRSGRSDYLLEEEARAVCSFATQSAPEFSEHLVFMGGGR